MRVGELLLRESATEVTSIRSGMYNMLSSAFYRAVNYRAYGSNYRAYGSVERQLWFRLRVALYDAVVTCTADTLSARR